jgi:HAE1 family hydrophobic/amphiphilic exporter-1
MRMTEVSIKRPVFVTMVTLGALVMGLLAVDKLGIDLFPDTSFPLASVQTVYPGASPTEIEERVTDKIEEAVAAINGVDRVQSFSRDSVSIVIIEFKMGIDERRATDEVSEKLAAIRGKLPDQVKDPVVQRIDPTALPVLTFAARSNRDPIELRDYVDDVLRPRLEKIPGVATVTIRGAPEREAHIEVDREALDRHGLTLMQVAQLVGSKTVDIPGGRITAGAREYGLKTEGRPQSIEALRELVLIPQPGGGSVRLGDIARVTMGTEEARTLSRVNGVPALTFEVQKQGGSNTVEIVDLVESSLAKLQLPGDIALEKIIDSSTFIRINIAHLWEHLLVGGIMAVLVIFLFMLDWRSTVISSLALPTSIITTFFFMWQLGFSLNIMSMLGLTLAIGILIDDSVVVRENIFRHMERGADPFTAAREGTKEIALAVFATTLTIIAVFIPVAFTGGIVGGFFREFGITVAVAVLISMIVSLTLDPMLSARITQKIEPDHHEKMRRKPVIGWIVRFYEGMDHVYASILRRTLNHKIATIVMAIAVFIGSLQLAPLMGQEFAGRGDRGEFTIQLELPGGTSLGRTTELAGEVEGLLKKSPHFRRVATTVGPSGEVEKATLRVQMSKAPERDVAIGQIMEDTRKQLAGIPGLSFYMREAGLGDGAMEEAPVTFFVQGPDYATLARVAGDMLLAARKVPGVRDASMTYRPGAVENRLRVDGEKATERGVIHQEVAATLRFAVEGEEVAKMRVGDKDVPVRLRLSPEDRADLASLGQLKVSSQKGRPVEIGAVAVVDQSTMPATIDRVDRQRQVTITTNVYGRSLGEVVGDLIPALEAVEKPEGYTYRFGGEAERMQETFANLGLAMGLAILFIYLVLASQFESFIHPFTIMMALPLAIIGALLALFMTGQAMGMASMIGLILLMGLVTKNSILLVDYANQLRDQGKTAMEALMIAGPTRLRPILMTSAAIILGMLPSAMGTGEGSEFQAPMAIGVIGGVITSTVLTVLVVPSIYMGFDRLTLKGRRERREQKRMKLAAAKASDATMTTTMARSGVES